MTNRERIRNCIQNKPIDRAPFVLYFGPWGETQERWEQECPGQLQINMGRSVRGDPGNTPGRRIKYCAVRVQNSAFLSPCQFLFFSVNENKGAPPVMKLKKDLNKFSTKGYASLGMMKKLTVVKLGEAAGPYGDRRPLDVTVQYLGDDIETFTIDDYFAIYAMGAGGEVHQLKREELSEIEIL